MRKFILRWEWQIAGTAIFCALLISGLVYGPRGLAGMAIGLAATWFNAWAMWRMANMLSATITDEAHLKIGTAFVVVAFLFKLPIVVALGFATRKIGGHALPCFVAGLGMVYFGLVGWASARS